jgi:subtilase family serine protease
MQRPWRRILSLAAITIVVGVGALGVRPHAIEDATNRAQLQSAAATGSGSTFDVGPRCRETAVYVVWGAGTGAGVITVETAHDASYAGTWAPLATVTWSAANKEDVVQFSGAYETVRSRISTNVTGGTVDTYARCN